jgi:hypothetical protein
MSDGAKAAEPMTKPMKKKAMKKAMAMDKGAIASPSPSALTIAGVLLYIACEEPPERRTLVTLRDYLTLAPDAFGALLARMHASRATGPPPTISFRSRRLLRVRVLG